MLNKRAALLKPHFTRRVLKSLGTFRKRFFIKCCCLNIFEVACKVSVNILELGSRVGFRQKQNVLDNKKTPA